MIEETQPASTSPEVTTSSEGGETTPRPRRRRRGGRGRSRTPTSTGGAKAETLLVEPEPAEAPGGDAGVPEGELKPAPARRRSRRGSRGRGRPKAAGAQPGGEAAAEEPAEAEAAEEPSVHEAPEGAGEDGVSGDGQAPKRRRRRRRKPAGAAAAEATGEAGEARPAAGRARPARSEEAREATAPARRRTRKPAPAAPETKAAEETEAAEETRPPTRRSRRKTSEAGEAAPMATRLRRGRQPTGRRRREALPVVPRVTDKLMVITEHGERDQIAILEGRDLVQHYVTRAGARSMVGNVYLGRVQNVLPGMEAAFVDVGRGRNAVLYAGEVNYSPEDLEGTPPRIEQVLKSGQSVLVQVTKDPIGGKGARLTAQISMPGRYLVLVPNSAVTGISRRLPDDERHRLKQILKSIPAEGHGVIIRTAAEGADEESLGEDVARLLDEWKAIEKKAKKAKAPALLYEEPELTVRAVRDLFTNEEFRELVTDSPRVYQLVTEYLAQVAPDLLPKVRLHQGKLPAFEEFHVVEQIHKGLDRKVWLASGGYIVIDRTEALTVIDVNTGKSVGRSNLEETVANTNVEAAREAARQLRLRDIGGMIIIDFIDMLLEQNKKKVVEALREEMAKDKTRSQVFDISPLGLLEVTRKRVSGGLLESFSETCPTCEGRGVLLTYEA